MKRGIVVIHCFMFAVLALVPSTATGIIRHDSNEPTNRPSDAVIGRWVGNASCVVINPNHVLTTRHQNSYGSGIGTTVAISEVDYKVVQETIIASDMRVARLTTTDGQLPNLSDYSALYTLSFEFGETVVIGGFGKVRGSDLQTDGITYGYLWASNPGNQLHWGSNLVSDINESDGYLYARFDDVGHGDHVPYEAIVAEYDSGGGWFIWHGSQWKVAGITKGVEHWNEAWFRNKLDPNYLDPDLFAALMVRTYSSDIAEVITSPKIISGYVRESNEPAQNVQIEAENGNIYTLTDSNGYYELWVPDGWTGTVSPEKAHLTFNPVSISYSNVTADISGEDYNVNILIFDDFNDNKRSANWRIFEDDRTSLWLAEANEILQILSVNEANYIESAYVSNGWGLDPSNDFSLKIDFHNEIVSEANSWLFVRFSPEPNTDDYISFEAGTVSNQRYFRYEQVADGNIITDYNSPRTTNDGTIFISFDAGADEFYLSYTDYGAGSDWQTITGLLRGLWSDEKVYIDIGAGADGIEISSSQMYLDDFVLNTGLLSDWPPKTDIDGSGFIDWLDVKMIHDQWLNPGTAQQANINGDEIVDFRDYAEFTEAW